METATQLPTDISKAVLVRADQDRFAGNRGFGINTVDFKVTSQESAGLFILELTFHNRGGPARHLHYEQDEWFYVVAGELILEVGPDRFVLKPGDAVWAPRRIPHVWAYVGAPGGKMLVGFTPAGQMEGFFLDGTKANQLPGQDSQAWRTYGMEAVGPPLLLE